MAVIAKEAKSPPGIPVLTLTLDNGDREKFIKAKEQWNFTDEQSLLRFVVSVLVESTDKKTIGVFTPIAGNL
ncbi:MAG: hypothetical protein PHW13_10170 [Methylococcales bacterium]|nr:hypothetical protein [Methylococcales bacterium]